MGELFGLTSILGSLAVAYWIAAATCTAAAIYFPKNKRTKAILGVIATGIFGLLPVKSYLDKRERDAYSSEAWAYFKKLCAEQSGEKIYKTFKDVRSVLVLKPLPPATDSDHFNQYWYGDPYSASATSVRARTAETTLTMDSRGPSGLQRGLEFVEVGEDLKGARRYLRIDRPVANDKLAKVSEIGTPESRFGIEWEDISTPSDRKYWVAGSRLRVIDRSDNQVVAERIGYLIEPGFGSTAGQRRPWLTGRGPNTTCPSISSGGYSDNWFLMKVFVQSKGQ